jgi:hydrogenase small subunit
MRSVEFAPGQSRTEHQVVHVLWLSSGLGCDGESVAMTAAENPSLEDLLRGVLPGMPRVALYNPMLAFESGEEYLSTFRRAAAGRLRPFVLVLEGSVANEEINGEGHWSGFGVNPATGQPITVNQWLDALAPRADAVLAVGTCAAYGGIPAMRGNPTGAMGLGDYLGPSWRSRLGTPIVNLPGCPVQPDNITETLLHLVLHVAGIEPLLPIDAQGRPEWMFTRTVQQSCGRAGFHEQGEFAETPADPRGCLVKLGCKGAVVKCNVPIRGWVGGIGGCPNVGGICIACTMPGFPDKFMPFHQPPPLATATELGARFTYGPLLRRLRSRAIRRRFDVEPDWRRPAGALGSGYEPRW